MAAAVSGLSPDHDGANAHGAELIEALLHAAFDDVFEMDDAEGATVFGYDKRCAAGTGAGVDGFADEVG